MTKKKMGFIFLTIGILCLIVGLIIAFTAETPTSAGRWLVTGSIVINTIGVTLLRQPKGE